MAPVWQGTVALQGLPAFAAGAQPAGVVQLAAEWSVLPAKIESSARVDASALKGHLENLLSKQSKWRVWLAAFQGDGDTAKDSCRNWCSDGKSKKIAVAELGSSSRLFFISPLAAPRDTIPAALLGDGSAVPTEPTCLLGVVAHRLRARNRPESDFGTDAAAAAAGSEARGTKRDGKGISKGKPAQRRQRQRTRASSDVLPLSTALTEGLDICALLDHRLATERSIAEVPEVVDFDADLDDSKPVIAQATCLELQITS